MNSKEKEQDFRPEVEILLLYVLDSIISIWNLVKT
jgi:hypothetical protein